MQSLRRAMLPLSVDRAVEHNAATPALRTLAVPELAEAIYTRCAPGDIRSLRRTCGLLRRAAQTPAVWKQEFWPATVHWPTREVVSVWTPEVHRPLGFTARGPSQRSLGSYRGEPWVLHTGALPEPPEGAAYERNLGLAFGLMLDRETTPDGRRARELDSAEGHHHLDVYRYLLKSGCRVAHLGRGSTSVDIASARRSKLASLGPTVTLVSVFGFPFYFGVLQGLGSGSHVANVAIGAWFPVSLGLRVYCDWLQKKQALEQALEPRQATLDVYALSFLQVAYRKQIDTRPRSRSAEPL